jgi:hypothetical protein
MTGKKETGAPGRQTTVVIRPDIYRQALERGIDISDTCNRALAGLTGCEYPAQQREEVMAPPPVIIAKDGSFLHGPGESGKTPSQKLHPVINADDPSAPSKVVQAKVPPVKKALVGPPAPLPAPVPAPVKEKPVADAAVITKKAAGKKGRDALKKKRSKGDALRTFFSQKIDRPDDMATVISKDELYGLFARFCHEHRITPVPEQKAVTVALKNQFALTEKNVNGIPSWTGIRLK